LNAVFFFFSDEDSFSILERSHFLIKIIEFGRAPESLRGVKVMAALFQLSPELDTARTSIDLVLMPT
jgi:hypothetical protein